MGINTAPSNIGAFIIPKRRVEMAKDDYDVIVFKILLYYYGILNIKCIFDIDVLKQRVGIKDISEEYFIAILRLLKKESLIDGLTFAHAWGNSYVVVGGLQALGKATITPDGIKFLKDDRDMKKVKEELENVPGAIAELIKLVSL